MTDTSHPNNSEDSVQKSEDHDPSRLQVSESAESASSREQELLSEPKIPSPIGAKALPEAQSPEISSSQVQWRFEGESSGTLPVRKKQVWLPIILFVLTCGSTFLIGTFYAGSNDPQDRIRTGLSYSACLMGILLAHEMGHYLQSVRYHVPASLPYFIPMPLPPFGTMGAVIIQHVTKVNGVITTIANRKQLFDIAVSGPIAGLALALPLMYYGVQHAEFVPMVESEQLDAIRYGEPLVLQLMTKAVHGSKADGQEIVFNSYLFAAWVGVFITALNLLPIGQLDGGHILYCLMKDKAHLVGATVTGGGILLSVLLQEYHYLPLIILILLFIRRHPPMTDEEQPLGTVRIMLGCLTLSFLILGFIPKPIILPE